MPCNTDVWSATELFKNRVRNCAGEDLGKIEDLTVDPLTGSVEYAFLSFRGLLRMENKLFPIPWTVLSISPLRDHIVADIDKEALKNAPAFDRDALSSMTDPVWRQTIHDYYRPPRTPISKHNYAGRYPLGPRSFSLVAVVLAILFVLGLAWVTFLVSTRGREQAKQDIKGTLQRAAYAAKETSHEATITTKVKTALSLSKRVPANKIDVNSEGDVVTLRGEVPSQEIRETAESIARDVPGVSDVKNHLFVDGFAVKSATCRTPITPMRKTVIVGFTANCGLAEFTLNESEEELLRRADEAQYVADRTEHRVYCQNRKKVCGSPSDCGFFREPLNRNPSGCLVGIAPIASFASLRG